VNGALELQVAALLGRVHVVRDERIGELRAASASQVEAIEAGARREARRLLRAASRAKRERVRERCREALAELDAEHRRREFEVDREVIDAALAALPEALERRWCDAAARRAWWANAIAVAAVRLVARDWHITLAGEPGEEERAALLAAVGAHGARAEIATGAARAGLTIAAGPSTVDATVTGLLADRDAIGAQLLAVWLGRAPR
jgi:hypothetical protein